MQILLLDNDRVFCQIFAERISEVLSIPLEQVTTVQDYDAALSLLHRSRQLDHPYDFIFVDYALTEDVLYEDDSILSGLDFITRVQDEGFLCPTVLITNYDDPSIEQRATQLGVQVMDKDWVGSTEDALREVCLRSISINSFHRRSLEKDLQERTRQFMELSFAISHEFKSSIGAVIAGVENIEFYREADALNEDVLAELLGSIDVSAQQGLGLASFLMTAAAQYGSISTEEVSLNSVVRRVIQRYDNLVSVEVLGLDPEHSVIFHEFILETILLILLQNVVDHGGERALLKFDFDKALQVSNFSIDVQDDGVGVPPSARRTIFRPGDRAGKPLNYNAQSGLGLGLAFSEYLVQLIREKGMVAEIACVDPLDLWTGARFRLQAQEGQVC